MNQSPDTSAEVLSRALGEAVVRIWGRLPHDIQQKIFEEAVGGRGADLRPQLAVYLHDKHPRTTTAMGARAMVEPDSLGG